MKVVISFEVRGLPKAQPRVKACRRGAHASVYDPGSAGEWKALVVAAARPHRPLRPLDGALLVSVDFLLPRPKKLMRKRDEDGEVWCTAKPDRDNLDKALLDALKQDGWFLDDALVCDGRVRKFYHSKTGCPGARVSVVSLSF